MIPIIKKLLFFSAIFCLIGLCCLFGGLYWFVVVDPGPEIEESYIETILARESPVLYSNGNDPIGVLFQKTHRRYLPFDAIPKMFINAITAAEDNQFFHHFGIDIPGIARAMFANIKAGRIVQGGSTITQQTAKNLFKRESRTFGAKLKELLFALRLEYHYSKEKILEFYCNQFFVSGNGHGLGVAARYYFDKEVEDLNLTELAFIAGSVKSPNTFNPFTKKNRASAQKARDRAKERTAYVLRKMYQQGMISQKERDSGLQEEILFKRGKMSYSLNSVIDSVKDALGSTSVMEALETQGISNVSTSGIRIITSIDKDIQERTLLALRRELSRLDVRMRGYNREEVQEEYRSLEYPGDTESRVGSFVFGTIINIREQENEGPLIDVQLDVKRQQGVLDIEGLSPMVTAHTKWRKQRWSSPGLDDLHLLLAELQKGDRVFVHLRAIEDNGKILLDLERFSELEGAALVTRQGMVKAMVGGMENRYFNRAVEAKRSMGSVFKPFLFAAAIQLGWNSTDPLDNRRNVFIFQGEPYFPRPDHHSPYDEVSMAWAGVHSENVAAVWLLYHLLDHLAPQHLREIASKLDMAPRTDQRGEVESYEHFKTRIRDDHGIVVDEETIRRAAFERAVTTLEADFLFDQRVDEYKQLLHCSYGRDFQNFTEQLNLELADEELDQKQRKELLLRKNILANNFLSLRSALQALLAHQRYYKAMLRPEEITIGGYPPPRPSLPQNGFFFLNAEHHLVFTPDPPGPENIRELLSPLDIYTQLQGLAPEKRTNFWQSILLGGHLNVYTVSEVNRQFEAELEQLRALPPYSMEVLCNVRDYLVMTGLQYLRGLGRETGIVSKLDPVLSFPLGSNVVSLFETVGMYETLILGNRYYLSRPPSTMATEEEEVSPGLSLIERIESADGKVIYTAHMNEKKIIDDKSRNEFIDILAHVVTHGTGRYAHQNVRLHSDDPARLRQLNLLNLPLPLLGKTGTANNFTNAAFVGFAPSLGLTNAPVMYPERGYTVGVYVGYDDNRPMEQSSTHLTGATGALPAWCDIVDAIYHTEKIGDRIDPVDLSFDGLTLAHPDTGYVLAPIDPTDGGIYQPIDSPRTGDPVLLLTHGRITEHALETEHAVKPFWTNSTTHDEAQP